MDLNEAFVKTLVTFCDSYGIFFDRDLFAENGIMTDDQKKLIEKLAGIMPVFVPDFDAEKPNMFKQVEVNVATDPDLDPMPMLDGNIALGDKAGLKTVFDGRTFFSIHTNKPRGPLNCWRIVSGWAELASMFSSAMADP